MGRYSSIEWAGKAVRESAEFVLAVTEQTWNYSSKIGAERGLAASLIAHATPSAQ